MEKHEYVILLGKVIAIDGKVNIELLTDILELNDKFYST